MPRRPDSEAVTAERPHLDRGALDPEEGSGLRRSPRPRGHDQAGRRVGYAPGISYSGPRKSDSGRNHDIT
jgi:hypothetical protein